MWIIRFWVHLNNCFSSYYTENTLYIYYTANCRKLFREIIALYSEKPINLVTGQNSASF
jgi:hypothetical protein